MGSDGRPQRGPGPDVGSAGTDARTHMTMRRGRPLWALTMLGAAVLTTTVSVGLGAPARATPARAAFGWWYRANQSPLDGASPGAKPPDAPANGLYFSAGPSGELSEGAVRFDAPVSGS